MAKSECIPFITARQMCLLLSYRAINCTVAILYPAWYHMLRLGFGKVQDPTVNILYLRDVNSKWQIFWWWANTTKCPEELLQMALSPESLQCKVKLVYCARQEMQYFWWDNSLNSLKLDWLHSLERVISHQLYNKTLRKNCLCVVSASSFSKEKQHKHWSAVLPIYQNLEKDCCWVAPNCVRQFFWVNSHGLYPTRIHCPCDSPSKNTDCCYFPPPGDSYSPRDRICISWGSCIGRQILATEPPVKPLKMIPEVKLRHSWLNLKSQGFRFSFLTTFPCLPSSRNIAMIFLK